MALTMAHAGMMELSKASHAWVLKNDFEPMEIDACPQPFEILFLPKELQILIACYFDPLTLIAASSTCKEMHEVCRNPCIWKELCLSTWSGIAKAGMWEEIEKTINWRQYFYQRKTFFSGNMEWKDHVASHHLPSPRQSLTGTEVNGSIVYIGGQTSVLQRFDDIFFYNPENRMFKKPPVRGSPPKFARHTACAIGNVIYIFGGFDGYGTFFGLAAYDTVSHTWYEPMTSGTSPVARTNHAVTSVGTKMYLFGGNDTTKPGKSDMRYGTYGDLQILDTETMTWHEPTRKGKSPCPRSGHHMITYGTKIFLFGGGLWNDTDKSWSEKYTDMFVFDTETEEWSEVEQKAIPTGSAFISLPHWGIGNFLFIFNDPIWCFDILNRQWHELKYKDNSPRPLKRFLGPATLVPSDHSVYMFGGVYASAMNNFDQLTWNPRVMDILRKEREIEKAGGDPGSPASAHAS